MDHCTEVFVGIDIAKSRDAVAIADGARGGEVRYLGEVDAPPLPGTRRVVQRLASIVPQRRCVGRVLDQHPEPDLHVFGNRIAVLRDGGTFGSEHSAIGAHAGTAPERKLRAMAGVATLLTFNPALGDAVTDALIGPRVAANRTLMVRAIARGEVAPSVPVGMLAPIVPPLAAFRALVRRQPFDRALLRAMIDDVLLPALGMDSRPAD